jgi:Arc/MetJ-type ribon-helix-helix transcriptional regulator
MRIGEWGIRIKAAKGNSMSVDIPSQYLPYVHEAVASGRFESESALIGEALELLVRRDRERKLVEEGMDQLDRGEYLEFDDEGLTRFFDGIKQEGRKQLREKGRTDV